MSALLLAAFVALSGVGFLVGCAYEHLRRGGSYDLGKRVKGFERAERLRRIGASAADQTLRAEGVRWR